MDAGTSERKGNMKAEQKCLEGIKVIDLFAGIGGFHLAFKSFGANIVYASEWDIEAAKIYEENYGLKPVGDITKIDEKDIPDHDIMCAGFPCQAFSISGNQRGFEDSRGTLFLMWRELQKKKKPKIIFLENVKNLVRHNGGQTYDTIKNVLNEIGYDVYDAILDSADYGSAQSRKRVYIVCFRKDMGIREFSFPEPLEKHKYVEDIIVEQDCDKYQITRNDVNFNNIKEMYVNKPLRIGTINKGGQGERIYSTKGKAITLSAYGGGVGAKTGLYYINGKIRKLSPRECARLQGFPDSFIISEKENIAYKQFGNSVVVDVLQQIIEKIVENEAVMRWL